MYNVTRNKLLCSKVRLATTFLGRLQGLLFSSELSEDEGLLLHPCNSIHTCFMRYPIDAVFLDNDYRVVALERNLLPWRINIAHPQARYVLELPAGQVALTLTEVGDILC